MYTITYDDTVIYDPRLEDRKIRSPKFHLAVSKAGSGSFLLDYDHPAAGRLKMLRGIVELQSDGVPIYRGRIIRPVSDFYNTYRIETEGVFACLNDSIIPPFEYPGGVDGADTAPNVVEHFFSWILSQHNSQVTQEQQLKLGTVTVADPNNYIVRSSTSYLKAIDVVKSRLLDLLGGYILERYEPDGTYLDYFAELPLTNTQSVEFGENLLDLTQEFHGGEVFTAILPTGKDGITIADEPDGDITDDLVKDGSIIYSKAGRALYGNITRTEKWDDVTLPYNLKARAVERLSGVGVLVPSTLTVKALDLGFTNTDVGHFRVGRNNLVNSAPHGISVKLPLMAMDLDILQPGETMVTLGQTSRSLSSQIGEVKKEVADTVRDDFKLALDDNQKNIMSEVEKNITYAVQNSQTVILAAMEKYVLTNDFEEYSKTVESQFQVLSGEISMNLTTTMETIQEYNGEMQKKYESISKAFRFTPDGLLIGETGNEVLLRLDNDVIQFLRNNVPALYINELGVYSEEVHINSIILGKYLFRYEADGRLSLRKVGNS